MKLLDRARLKDLVDRRVEADVEAGRVGGAAVLVTQDGETVYQNFFGATVPSGNEPITADTVFRLASMTKPITAIAALIVQERGLFCLDDPVSNYLPQYESMQIATLDKSGKPQITGESKTPITLRHLLCHASGIGSMEMGTYLAGQMTKAELATLASAVAYYADQPLAFEPYSKQAYSPVAAFDVLARIIELVTGEEYGTFLKKEIFDPCEMKDTSFTPTSEQWARMIAMHDYRDGKACVFPMTKGCVFETVPTTHALAGAGLISTLNDYRNFAEMLLNGGEFHGKRIVSAQMIDEMATPQIDDPMKGGRSLWGLSVRVLTNPQDILPLGTFGWSGAYGTHFWIDRENRITAIYLKNSKYDGGSGAKTSYHFEEDVYHSLIQ